MLLENSEPEQLQTFLADRERFLAEFVQLKADSCYIRDYRDYYGKWVTGISVLRAVTSLASVGGWLTVSHLAWLWATLLVAAQLAEALQGTFPFAKKRLALSRWCRKLDELVVTAQGTWDEIESRKMNGVQIRKALRLLRVQKNKAQAKAVPNGLPKRNVLFAQALAETASFFAHRYDASIQK